MRATTVVELGGANVALPVKVLFLLWFGYGVASIILLFRRGLATGVVRRFARGGGAGLGWAALAVLLPLMLVTGALPFLAVMISEEKIQCPSCGRRLGVLEVRCSGCGWAGGEVAGRAQPA